MEMLLLELISLSPDTTYEKGLKWTPTQVRRICEILHWSFNTIDHEVKKSICRIHVNFTFKREKMNLYSTLIMFMSTL